MCNVQQALLVILCVILAGCVSTKYGWGYNAYQKQNYDLAARNWNYAAKHGNADAQNGLGVLWQSGLGSTPKNLNEAAAWYLKAAKQGHLLAMNNLARVQIQLGHTAAAISWLTLAARWGDQNAASTLLSLGVTAPDPDLLRQKQRNDFIAQEQERIESERQAEALNAAALNQLQGMSFNLGCALSGKSCGDPIPTYSEPRAQSQMPSVVNDASDCVSDVQCGVSARCIKQASHARGRCMVITDEYGLKQYNTGNDAPVYQCSDSQSCPLGYFCESKYKVCMKRQP